MEETFKIIESNPALTPQPNHGTELPHPVFSKHIQAGPSNSYYFAQGSLEP